MALTILRGGKAKEVIATPLEEKALVYANVFQEDSDEGLLCSYLRVPILPEEFVERAGRFRVPGGGFGGLGVEWSGSNRSDRRSVFIIRAV